MATSFKTVGAWSRVRHVLSPTRFDAALKAEVRRATLQNAMIAVQRIRAAITGGKYSPNASLTVALKRSSKALVETGQLFQAVTHQIIDYKTAFVGFVRRGGDEAGDDVDLVDLAVVVHEGVTLPVTPAMRGLFYNLWLLTSGKAAGLPTMSPRLAELYEQAKRAQVIVKPLSAGTTAIVVPPRPFLREPMESTALQLIFKKRWEAAVARAMKGESGGG